MKTPSRICLNNDQINVINCYDTMYSATCPRDSSVSVFARTYQITRVHARWYFAGLLINSSSTANCRFCSLSRGEEDPSVIVEPTLFSLSFSQSPSLSVSLLFFFLVTPADTREYVKIRHRNERFPSFFLSSRNCVIIFNNVTTIAFSAERRHTQYNTAEPFCGSSVFGTCCTGCLKLTY